MSELQVLNGPLQWQTIKVDGQRFLIGRREGCHLVLKDGWISREHAVILELAPGQYIVQDRESENGIFVNAVRVTESPLRHNDILRVGRTEMRFYSPPPSEAGLEPRGRDSTVQDKELRPIADATWPGAHSNAVTGAAIPMPQVRPSFMNAPEPPTDPAALDMTVHEPGGAKAPRFDLRDRVRRLEKVLQDKEEDNARLAAENAVLKRALATAGLLNRATGQVDVKRLRTPVPREVTPDGILPLIWNPLASVSFPAIEGGTLQAGSTGGAPESAVGIFKIGVIGAGAGGARLADAFHRVGYRRAVVLSSNAGALAELGIPEPSRRQIVLPEGTESLHDGRKAVAAVQPELEMTLRESLGTDRDLYLISLGLGGVTGVASLPPLLEMLGEVDRIARAKQADSIPTGVLFAVPTKDEIDAQGPAVRALVREGVESARTLFEAGKTRPFIVVENRRIANWIGGNLDDSRARCNDAIAGAVDAMNRLPLLHSVGGNMDADAMRALWLESGLVTLGMAATSKVGDAEALRQAVRHALTEGLLAGHLPASRARTAAIIAVIGSGVAAGVGAQVLTRVEAAVEEAKGILPQARPLTGIYQDNGASVRILTWVGGLPFPEGMVE